MRPVTGVVKHYAWGDQAFIPDLLGIARDGHPWAELWLGTHPKGPTALDDGRSLVEVTGELPYLLKVLAAAAPLSLQTHPNAHQATIGYERGEYPDPNPKPELLVALTRFEAFCGVRPVDDTVALLRHVGADALADVVADHGPGVALDGLYRGTIDPAPAIEACRSASTERIEVRWARRLDDLYPGEPSVVVSLLLNLVQLEPGECVRLDAGNLHGYLSGSGIELMGNSDNVIRGGLTSKHVDVDGLLAVVDATPLVEPVLAVSDEYELPAAGVALRRLTSGTEHTATGHELAVDLDGGTWYLAPGDRVRMPADSFVVVPLAE